MLLDPRCHGEDVGIENDIGGFETDADQKAIGTFANCDLASGGIGLALFIERHDDGGGAIAHHLARLVEKLRLALLEADRIDDALSGKALQPGLDDGPFRAVDHYRHPGDIGFGGNQLEKRHHREFAVEQPFVHVDIDDLRAVLDLLARDLDRGGIIAVKDQLFEGR